jgi:2-phosphoglycerate kinase
MGRRDWEVLLIGGASGVGKTQVSYRLARQLEMGLTEIDDLHIALERMTTPAQQPDLHYWRTHPEANQLPAEEILQRHLEVGVALRPAVEAVIANHLADGPAIVLEGDYLHPELAAQAMFGTQPAAGRVSAVFLVENDQERLARNFLARDGTEQNKRAEVSWLYGQWLAREAANHGVPVVAARPWENVLERVLGALGKTK